MRSMRGQAQSLLKAMWVVCCLGGPMSERTRADAASPRDTQEYTSQAWQVEDGLPQSSVTSIVQTRDGYLWLATFNGLVRFDGVRFRVFHDGNTPELPNSRLVRLDLDQHGDLWIISEDGALTSFRRGRFRRHREDGFPSSGAAAVVRGPKGRLLLVDRQGAVHQLSGGKWVQGPDWEFLKGRPVSLFTHKDQVWAWLRQKGALGPIVGNELVELMGPDGLRDVQVRALAVSRRGGLWLLLADQIWHYDGETGWQPTDWKLPNPVGGLTCMIEDRKGNLWISTYGQGLFRFGPSGGCQRFRTEGNPGLSHNSVRALWEDVEGSLWVGTDGGGLNRLKPRLVTMYGLRQGLTATVVMSVAQDQVDPGMIWVGLNGGGVNQLRFGEVKPLIIEPKLNTNGFAYCVFGDRQGGLWIGTYDLGIMRVQNGTLNQVAEHDNWTGKPLLAALEDRAGRMWLGGSFGLMRWAGGECANLNAEAGLSSIVVRALAEDRAGTVYVGTSGGGLATWREGQWARYTEKEGLADNHIGALWADASNTLWIGTANGGLGRLKDGRFTAYTTREGLPANNIASILEDDSGHLWIGSNRGLFRVPKAQLEDLAAGRGSYVSGLTYGVADGLSSLECGRACRGHDGKLWFATSKGVASVDPAKLPINTLAPPVVIEEVLMDGQPWVPSGIPEAISVSGVSKPEADGDDELRAARPGGETPSGKLVPQRLVVPAGCDRVEFRFTGLSFLAPEKVRFRYRLEGYDRQWLEAGVERAAFYTRLPPGGYRFRVRACNNDGVWSETGATLAMLVLPPWWMTWWFRVAALAAVAGWVFWILEARVRRVKREHALQSALSRRLIETQEAERKRIAAELHDSLGQNLLVIKNRALLGLQDDAVSARSSEQFDEISRTASTSLAEVRQISHDLRPYQLDRLGLSKALQAMAADVSAASGFRCVTQIEPVDRLIAAPMEIHCYRIVQELLNNVVKHSNASEARLRATVQQDRIVLMVEDDGCGFDMEAVRRLAGGAGLTDVHERVRMLGGRLKCESRSAEGTRWRIEIPTAPKTHI